MNDLHRGDAEHAKNGPRSVNGGNGKDGFHRGGAENAEKGKRIVGVNDVNDSHR